MKKIIFDTETTSINPGNICQLSYIVMDNEKVSGKNYFFKVPYVEPGAERVHGFSVGKLEELSGGRRFSEQCEEIFEDFNGADVLIAHNFSFDIKFLEKEFSACGKEIEYAGWMCTMKHFTNICQIEKANGTYKWPKLEELMKKLKISKNIVIEKLKELYGDQDAGLHDARYDATATYLCYLEGERLGYCENAVHKRNKSVKRAEVERSEVATNKTQIKKRNFVDLKHNEEYIKCRECGWNNANVLKKEVMEPFNPKGFEAWIGYIVLVIISGGILLFPILLVVIFSNSVPKSKKIKYHINCPKCKRDYEKTIEIPIK